MPKGRTTLAEIADAAGVSVATVSKVLNDRTDVSLETRRRVQKHLRDSKYRPAGSSSARPRELTRAIEVVVPELQSPYIIAVLEGITSSAAAEGFEVVIGASGLNPQVLLQSDHAGAIFITADASSSAVKALDEGGFPVVVVDPRPSCRYQVHQHRCHQLHRRHYCCRTPALPRASTYCACWRPAFGGLQPCSASRLQLCTAPGRHPTG